jgi:O-antigen/teichoic acid export membrane protein
VAAEGRPFRKRILLNTAWSGVGTAWAMVVTIVTLPITLHGLGAEVFGLWVLLSTFSAMTGWFSLADLGVGVAATRDIAARVAIDDHAGASRVITSAITLFVGLGAAFGLLFAALGPWVLPPLFDTAPDLVTDLRVAIIVYAIQVVVDQASNACQASLDGLQRADLSRLADGLRRTVVAVAVAVVATLGGDLPQVAVASLGASLVGLVVVTLVLHRVRRTWWRHRPGVEHIRELLAYGKTVAVLRPIGVIHRQIDRLVVGAILGPSAVSLVEIATQIQNGAEAVLSSSSYAVLPAASWVRAREDHASLTELLIRGTKYTCMVTLPIVVGAMFLVAPIVSVWVGNANIEAAGLAALALAYTGITAPMQVSSMLLVGVGRATIVLRAAAAAILVNLVGSIVLVHLIGIAGAFVATLAGGLVLIPVIIRAGTAEVDVRASTFARDALVPLLVPLAALALVVALVVVSPLSDLATILVAALLGALVYGGAALRFSISRQERLLLRQSLRSRAPDIDDGSDSSEPPI